MTDRPYEYDGPPHQPGDWISWYPIDGDDSSRIDGEIVVSHRLVFRIHRMTGSAPSLKDPLGRTPEIGANASPWCGRVRVAERPARAVGLGAYVEWRPSDGGPDRFVRGLIVAQTGDLEHASLRVVERGPDPWCSRCVGEVRTVSRSECAVTRPVAVGDSVEWRSGVSWWRGRVTSVRRDGSVGSIHVEDGVGGVGGEVFPASGHYWRLNPLAGRALVFAGLFRRPGEYAARLAAVGARRHLTVSPGADYVVMGDRTPKTHGVPSASLTRAKIDEAVRLRIPVVTETWLEARLSGCACISPDTVHDSRCRLHQDPDELVRLPSETSVRIDLSDCAECVAPYNQRPRACVHGLMARRSPRPEDGDRVVWISPGDSGRWARGTLRDRGPRLKWLEVSEASEPWRPMVGTMQLVMLASLTLEHRRADLVGGLTPDECLTRWMENRLFAEGGSPLPNSLAEDQVATARALWMRRESPRRSAELAARVASGETRSVAVVSPDHDLEIEILGGDVRDPLNHPPIRRADVSVPVR